MNGIPGCSQGCDRKQNGDTVFLPESASPGHTGWDGTGPCGAAVWLPFPFSGAAEGTVATSLVLGGGVSVGLWVSPMVARQQLWHLLAEVVVDGWLCHCKLCWRNRLLSSCPPCECHPTPDVDSSYYQQLPSALLSTPVCGSPFAPVLSGQRQSCLARTSPVAATCGETTRSCPLVITRGQTGLCMVRDILETPGLL